MRVPDPPGFHHNAHEGIRLVRLAIAQQIIHRESIVCQTISDRPPMVHTSPIATIVRNDTRHNPSSWQRRSAIAFSHPSLSAIDLSIVLFADATTARAPAPDF